jgi:uncharacterized protein YkwD
MISRRGVVAGAAVALAGCSDYGVDARAAERHTRDRLNETRTEAGVGALTASETLATAAREHARDMHERDFYAHTNPDGEAPEDRVACGAGENIHRGEIGPLESNDGETWLTDDPEQLAGYLIRDWTLSEEHYQNMIDPDWRRVGIGIAVESGSFFAVSMFC